MAKLFAGGGKKIIVGLLAMIVTVSFGFITLADGLLLIKVRKNNCEGDHRSFVRFIDYIVNQGQLLNKPNENSNRLLSTSKFEQSQVIKTPFLFLSVQLYVAQLVKSQQLV